LGIKKFTDLDEVVGGEGKAKFFKDQGEEATISVFDDFLEDDLSWL
jgi:hypothetical protein